MVIDNCPDKINDFVKVCIGSIISAGQILMCYVIYYMIKGFIVVCCAFAKSGGLSGAAVFAGRPGICG